jgi:hypothetical protein
LSAHTSILRLLVGIPNPHPFSVLSAIVAKPENTHLFHVAPWSVE